MIVPNSKADEWRSISIGPRCWVQHCLYGEGQDQSVKMGVRTKVAQMSNLGLGHYCKGVPPAVLSSHVLCACRRQIFTGVTAQILPSLSAVRGQLRTRPT